MASHFSHACQTVIAYRSLTASLLKRLKIQNLIGVELLWLDIEGGIFKIIGWWSTFAAAELTICGKEDVTSFGEIFFPAEY